MVKKVELLPLKDVARDPEAISEQIEVRKRLKSDCVGWLYPGILQGEIDQLRDLLKDPPQGQG